MSRQWPSSRHLCACLCERSYNSQDESALTVACTSAWRTSHVGQDVYLSYSAWLGGCTRGRGPLSPPLLRPHPKQSYHGGTPPQKQPANPLWRWRLNLGVTGQDGGPDNESTLDTRQQPPPPPHPRETRKSCSRALGGGVQSGRSVLVRCCRMWVKLS